MRGKQGMNYVVLMGRRITPAHAGKTISDPAIPAVVSDHPRACGENVQSDSLLNI
nr:MAG TPA: hypothetical protein [Caudoviricetes sp.]